MDVWYEDSRVYPESHPSFAEYRADPEYRLNAQIVTQIFVPIHEIDSRIRHRSWHYADPVMLSGAALSVFEPIPTRSTGR